jgi:signal peptidase I
MFWPANLGGRTTFVTTHGTSMHPRFHSGDLAVVQPAGAYRLGDIVAYRSTTLHGAIVLHRIVAVDNGHFTFKGDNNDFRDPDHPTAAQVVGKLRMRIPHGGAIRGLLARPLVLFPLLAVVLGGLTARPATRSPRRKRDGARGGGREQRVAGARPRSMQLGSMSVAVFVAGALATSGAILTEATIWRAPRTRAATTALPFRQRATLGYSGVAPAGAVYPSGRIHTGDPVFTRMVPRVTIDLGFAMTAPERLDRVRASVQLVADFSSATGWHRQLALGAPQTFAGGHVRATATLDLTALHLIEQAFTAQTGLATPDASLRISGRVQVGGTLAGMHIGGELAPHLDFQLTPVELVPLLSTTSAGSVPDGASVSKSGSVPVAIPRPRTFGVWRVRVSRSVALLLSLALVAAILACGAALLVFDRRRLSLGAAGATVARYRNFVVNADAIPPAGKRPTVRVHNMRDLTRLARLHEEFIVHAEQSGAHRFALLTDSVVYTYDIGSAAPVPATTDTGTGAPADADTDLARWALAGLEACAAERRHAQRRRHLGAPSGAEHSRPTR